MPKKPKSWRGEPGEFNENYTPFEPSDDFADVTTRKERQALKEWKKSKRRGGVPVSAPSDTPIAGLIAILKIIPFVILLLIALPVFIVLLFIVFPILIPILLVTGVIIWGMVKSPSVRKIVKILVLSILAIGALVVAIGMFYGVASNIDISSVLAKLGFIILIIIGFSGLIAGMMYVVYLASTKTGKNKSSQNKRKPKISFKAFYFDMGKSYQEKRKSKNPPKKPKPINVTIDIKPSGTTERIVKDGKVWSLIKNGKVIIKDGKK